MVSIGDGQQAVMFPAEQDKLLESLMAQVSVKKAPTYRRVTQALEILTTFQCNLFLQLASGIDRFLYTKYIDSGDESFSSVVHSLMLGMCGICVPLPRQSLGLLCFATLFAGRRPVYDICHRYSPPLSPWLTTADSFPTHHVYTLQSSRVEVNNCDIS